MRQTFYIDLEEEISSVIDRLNKSMATENYFVVPKRALFLQSIVNMKLLKREAEKIGKHVTIITQDEVGASMAERSGLLVQSVIDEQEKEGVENDVMEEKSDDVEIPEIVAKPQHKKQIRLSGVGTDSFYDTGLHRSEELVGKKTKRLHVNPVKHELHDKGLDSQKSKVLEKMYAAKKHDSLSKEHVKSPTKSEGRIKKLFAGFVGLCLFVFMGVAGYLFWPSARIIIEPNITINKIDLDLQGKADITNVAQLVVPVRVLDREENLTLSYEVKGQGLSGGKKAHGSVVIYNQYDSSPQTLIATTRLESSDGKIFRLVKNVIVPGSTTVAGEVKPGAITAEVIADRSGSEYNIDQANFTIPGFKDGPKYDKFYAKATDPIAGGSIDDTAAVTGGTVTQADIDGARQKTEAALKEKMSQSVKDALIEGEVALPMAERINITKSSSSLKTGSLATTFDYSVLASAHVLIFSENDVKKVIQQSLAADQVIKGVNREISKVDYGTVNADFDKNTLEFKIHSDVVNTPIIDKEQIKNDLLGKSDEQLAAILRKYDTIKNVNIEFRPTFISRIPQYSQRVSVEVQDSSN